MQEDYSEELCARLCLLTYMAWDNSLPRPFTRVALQTLDENCALDGLVLREPASVPQKTLLRARLLLTRTTGFLNRFSDTRSRGIAVWFAEAQIGRMRCASFGEMSRIFSLPREI